MNLHNLVFVLGITTFAAICLIAISIGYIYTNLIPDKKKESGIAYAALYLLLTVPLVYLAATFINPLIMPVINPSNSDVTKIFMILVEGLFIGACYQFPMKYMNKKKIDSKNEPAANPISDSPEVEFQASHLNQALELAMKAHRDQKDRAGLPYIMHIVRVVDGCRGNIKAMTVAALHDIVEDTPIGLQELSGLGFPKVIVNAVDAMTKRDGELYDDYLGRVLSNSLACIVKKSDLEDNMDLTRLSTITEKDNYRNLRYLKAHKAVCGVIASSKTQ